MNRLLAILVCFAPMAQAHQVASANLSNVTDGVFTMQEGQSLDITDENLLITLVNGGDGCVTLSMNGGSACIANGHRLHLKSLGNAPFYIRGMFTEKQTCFLDVFNVVTVKGQPATADFRLLCE